MMRGALFLPASRQPAGGNWGYDRHLPRTRTFTGHRVVSSIQPEAASAGRNRQSVTIEVLGENLNYKCLAYRVTTPRHIHAELWRKLLDVFEKM